MTPTPYPELNAVLGDMLRRIQQLLGASFIGAYLQGSFAVGDFDRDSDVDWIVVTRQELSRKQVHSLQTMHEWIFSLDCPWAQHLEGSYFPRAVLKDYRQSGSPLWYLDHGSRSLIRHDHCNTIVVRSVVREYGVPLVGPDPRSLINPIPVEALRQEIWDVMTGWWQEIRANPESINNRFYQAFAVLNYCRMLHDLRNGAVGSKRAGAEWVKAHLGRRWAGLIDRSWSGRPDPAVSVRQLADPDDLKLTLEFIPYVLEVADAYRTLE